MQKGNSTLIDIVLKKFNSSLELRTATLLSPMHCAAQCYVGYIGILILHSEYKADVNVRDAYEATPLHFAVLKQELLNVMLLIKCGADVNATDMRG